MKKIKLERGITLIALIITIVVLLILAVVTISSIKNNNIITYAQNASTDYNSAKADEESVISGYEALIGESIGGGSGVGKATLGTIVQKNSTINGKEYSSSNPVIPRGFMAINVTTKGHESYWDAKSGPEVTEGLVISDGISEFVWIPVPEMDKFAELYEDTNYQGVLYNFSSATATEKSDYGVDTTSYREPANLSTTYDTASKMSIWTDTLYQTSFNKMIASVSKYGGFYVGRYETSLNGSVAQSKSEETPMNNVNWYRMYEYSLTYSTSNSGLGVTSEMIWGCQWDAMLKFILTGSEESHVTEKTNVGHTLSDFTTVPYATGGTDYTGILAYNDIVSNIYDLEGNVTEWTQETVNTYGRVYRGGSYSISSSPSGRYSDGFPIFSNNYTGSRLSLYVEL